MGEIISKCVKLSFAQLGIVENDPGSLWYYEENSFARVRKPLPTMHSFYMILLQEQATNTDKFKENAYSLLLGEYEDFVEELYYNPVTLEELTRDEYEALPVDRQGKVILS